MKKMFTLFLGVALAATVSAQDVDVVVKKFQNAPTIGGGKDAIWDEVDKQVVDAQDLTGFAAPTISECYFKMGWTDAGLFILVYRNEDDFANQFETKISDWQSDRDEIFFDVNNGKGNADTLVNDGRFCNKPGSTYGHYQFTSLWQEKNQTDTTFAGSQWYHYAPFTAGYKFLGENTYYYEYQIPLSSLTIDNLVATWVANADTAPLMAGAGQKFQFTISVNDVDMADAPADEKKRKYLRWTPTLGKDPWGNMDSCAVMLLSDTLITAVKDVKVANFVSVYPNPAANYIMSNVDGNVAIYNLTGQLVLEQKNVKASQEINISNLKNGTYFVKIGDQTTKVSVIR